MCIIVSKPKGVEMPSIATLRTCWRNNGDGAGLCYTKNGFSDVLIHKGFMRFKHLVEKIEALNLGVNDNVVIHFRMATHGLVDGGNCHPFPISKSTDDLRSLVFKCKVAVAHNGIFGNMPGHDILSDTQKFIGKILSNNYIINGIHTQAVRELLRGYCGTSSKLAILRTAGLIHIGQFVQDKGVYYSNESYKPIEYKTYDYKKWKSSCDTIATDKCCAYCGVKQEIDYYEDLGVYLCDYCASFNFRE